VTTGQFTESVVELAILAWFERPGWRVTHGLEIAPGDARAERPENGLIVPALVRDCAERLQAASRLNIES